MMTRTAPVALLTLLVTLVTSTPNGSTHPQVIPQAAQVVPSVVDTRGVPQTAQSREAPAYTGGGSGFGGFSGGGSGGHSGGGGGGHGGGHGGGDYGQVSQPQGNTGYYYYYYPVAQEKEPAVHHSSHESFGIDPWGIVAMLAICGLLMGGAYFMMPGWSWAPGHQDVYYRAFQTAGPSLIGMEKDDFKTLTALVLTAIEGEQCMERLACDAGKLVKKVKRAETFLRLMEDFAPNSFAASIKSLRTGIKSPDQCRNVNCQRRRK